MAIKPINRLSGERSFQLIADREQHRESAYRECVKFYGGWYAAEAEDAYITVIGHKRSFEEARQQLHIAALESDLFGCQREVERLATQCFAALSLASALELRIAQLEDERSARSAAPQGSITADPRLLDVLEVTQEMFGGRPSVALMRDPEDPEVPFLVVTVKSRGQARELIERRLEWHDRVSKISPGNSGTFRLSIIPE